MRNPIQFRLLLFGLAVFIGGSVNGPHVCAQSVTSIEEDWSLELNTPNSDKNSPQLNCLSSAGADLTSLYAIFLVNQLGPDGGNLRLQLWDGEVLLTSTDVPNTSNVLDTLGEKISWTLRLSVNKGKVTAEVLNLSSDTWGRSTGQTSIASISANTSLNDFDHYDPNVTCANSGVEFGNDRVKKLILRKTRIYTGKQKSVETSLERVVFQNN